MSALIIRQALIEDLPVLCAISLQMGDKHDSVYFTRSLEERKVFVAFVGESPAGYVQLNMNPSYEFFRSRDIPEIQDLNVAPDFRGRGIGRSLVDSCELFVRSVGGEEIGLGVGLHARFGAAQRLYAKCGYVPDGAGVVYDDLPVRMGELRALDDFMVLKMVKSLK